MDPVSVRAAAHDIPDLQRLEHMLERQGNHVSQPAQLVTPDGEALTLPTSIVDLLREMVPALARGETVTLVQTQTTMSLQEAADYLNVPQPFLIELLDAGTIVAVDVDMQRRVALADLAAYRQHRDEERQEALARLTQMSQDFGLYGR